ncbi:MAG: ComEC/Rec2 family competence protein [Patescibacteria group bacterium]
MKKKLWLVVVLAAALALGQAWLKLPATFELHMLDIGQGDAILLRTESGENILIDGGPGSAVLEELGEVLSPFDRRLDLVILTHPHEDHVAGLVPVLQRFDVGEVMLSAPDYGNEAYEAFMEEIGRRGIPYSFADDEHDFEFGDLRLDVLFPFEPYTGDSMDNVNNASPVIRASWRDVSILFTGDAEMEVEEALLAAGVDMEADLLKAGHHGSKSSSTLEFLEAVGAEFMLISCAAGNDYGHPHSETLEKAGDLDMEVWRTDLEGRIAVIFGEGGYEVRTER